MAEILTLESLLKFGKHKDEQVEDLIYDDPRYIAWLVEKEAVQFDETALALIKKMRIV